MEQKTQVQLVPVVSPLLKSTDDRSPADQPAPRWLHLGVYFFRLGIGLFLALSLLLSSCAVLASEDFWKPATSVLTPEQVRVIIAEESIYTIDTVPEDWIEQARAHQAGNLTLINFDESDLCGHAGCLYVGYTQDETSASLKQVLYLRLNPALPPGVPLFEEAEQSFNGLPCLTVHQLEQNRLLAIGFCFNGMRYQEQSSVEIPNPSESPNSRHQLAPKSRPRHESNQH
jgi:hypothetical protein